MEMTVPSIRPDGTVEQRDVPFVIGILADLSRRWPAVGTPMSERRFFPADEAALDAIPEFQGAAALHGVRYLTSTLGSLSNVRIKIADVAKRELWEDFLRVPDISESWLYCQLFGHGDSPSGAAPFALLIVDYEFNNERHDLELLSYLATLADFSFAPVLTAAGARMFGQRSFRELTGTRSPSTVFEGDDYARWRSFRDNTNGARFVVLTIPPVMVTRSQAPDHLPPAVVDFGTRTKTAKKSEMSSAYLLCSRLAELFSVADWWSVLDAPESEFHFDAGLVRQAGLGLGAVSICAEHESELSQAGFAVLSGDAEGFAFHEPVTLARPKQYLKPEENEFAAADSRLINVMARSRLAQHVYKAAEYLGQLALSPEDLKHSLDDWIERYVRVADSASGEPGDQSGPLAEARFDVRYLLGSKEQIISVRAELRFRLHSEAPFGKYSNRIYFRLPSVSRTNVLN